MGVLDEKTIGRIKSQLKHHPRGLMISDLSSMTKINRNIMAKYLEILLMSGQVEMEMRGNAKVYTLSKRAPLSALFESSSDCIILLDGKKRILWVNAPVMGLTGKDAGEFAGKNLSDIDDPLFAALPDGDGSGTAGSVSEISCVRNGEPHYYRIRQTPAVLADGSNGSILSCEDVTTEVVFQQMVELSEARFRAIIEDQTEFIARFLPDGPLTFVNGSFARAAGKKPEELVGTQFFLHIHADDVPAFKEKLQATGPDNAVVTLRCRGIGADGQVRRLQWTVRALFDKENRLSEYQAVGRDITEQAEAVGRLRRHAGDLEFITRKAREFLELPPEADLYAAIAEGLSEILPDAAISVCSFDPPPPVFTIRNVCGIGARETFRQVTGTDIVGLSVEIKDPEAIEFIKKERLHKAYGDLYNALFGQVPYLVCKQLEEILNLDEIHILGLVSRELLLGCATILPRKGSSIPDPRFIEAFIQQASLVLAWKRTDEALRKSEGRFRAIVEDQTEFIARFLPDGPLTYVNRSYARYLGKEPQELYGQPHIPYIVNEVVSILLERYDANRPDSAVMTVQCRAADAAGTPKWHEWTVRALPGADGAVAEFQGVGRDITELHEASESTRQHISDMEFLSRKAREFLELPPGADIYTAIMYGLRELAPDSTITICSFNPHASALVGRGIWPEDLRTFIIGVAGGDFIGRPFFVRDPEALSNWSAGRIIRIPGDLYSIMFGMIPITVSQQIEEKFSIGGDKFSIGLVSHDRILGAVLIIPRDRKPLPHRDLIETYLQQASIALAQRVDADALRQSEERFRSVIENQTEFVTRFLPDGTLTFVNTPLCRALGKSPEEVLGRSFFSMILDDDLQILMAGLASMTAENPSMTTEQRFFIPDGRTRWFQWTNRATFDERGQVVEYDGIGRDITELHEAAERIRKHPADIRFLARNARALAGSQTEEEILSAAARGIRSLVPEAMVGVCGYDHGAGSLSFRCLEGTPEDLSAISHELRQDPAKTAFALPADTELLSLFSGKRLAPAPGHIGFLFRSVSPDICNRIGERCNFGRSYVMGLPSQDGTTVAVLVQLKAGTDLKNPELVEAAIAQAGLALARVGREPE
jgi:PAS domain S-box-containing protein